MKTCHGLQVPASKYTGAKGDTEPEDEEYARIYYPWLSWNLNSTNHVVDRNGDLVGGLHENINHEIYKNVNSNLHRLHGSFTYKAKIWLHSISEITDSVSGIGFGAGSFGISENSHAPLLGNLPQIEQRGRGPNPIELEIGFSMDKGRISVRDTVLPLPNFSLSFVLNDKSNLSNLLSQQSKQVRKYIHIGFFYK